MTLSYNQGLVNGREEFELEQRINEALKREVATYLAETERDVLSVTVNMRCLPALDFSGSIYLDGDIKIIDRPGRDDLTFGS